MGHNQKFAVITRAYRPSEQGGQTVMLSTLNI